MALSRTSLSPAGETAELSVPRRSVPGAVAEVLRREIGRGRWAEFLPGERHLMALLQVSRTSLRPALELLEREGRLRNAHGRRRRIVRPRKGGAAPATGMVAMLSPVPLERIEPFVLLQLENLRELLARRRMTLHIEARASCFSGRPERALGAVTGEVGADVWILWRSTRAVQEWFVRRKRRHIVFGTAFLPGVPYVDLDHHATGRHAAATLARLGHRRIALIIPDSSLAGDAATAAGFAEKAGVKIDIVKHDGSPQGAARAVDRILTLHPRPTGILSAGGVQTIGVATRLMECGVRLPGEMSLLSRDDDPALAYLNPSPARYVRPQLKFARGIVKQIEHCLAVRHAPPVGILVFPSLLPGATLGKAPAAR